MTPIRHAAEHEAAHVMVAIYFRTPIVNCVAYRDGSGSCDLAPDDGLDADAMLRAAVIASAGVALDTMFGRASNAPDDLYKARRFQEEFARLAGREMICPVRAATAILQGRVDWDAFKRVAAALETGRVLTGADVDALVSTEAAQQAAAERAMATHRRLTQPPRLVVNEYGRWLYPADTSGG